MHSTKLQVNVKSGMTGPKIAHTRTHTALWTGFEGLSQRVCDGIEKGQRFRPSTCAQMHAHVSQMLRRSHGRMQEREAEWVGSAGGVDLGW